MKKRVFSMGALTLFALILASCGGGGDEPPALDITPEGLATPAPTETVAAEPTAEPVEEAAGRAGA